MEHHRTVLDHGLRVVTTPMPHSRSVSVSVFIGSGSRYEPAELAGISHFVEHMLFKGTSQRPSPKEISEAIEGVGGILNAATDKELTVYWCKVPAQHFDLAMDVLSDNILHSRFDPLDVEKERSVIIEELNMTLDSPSDLANLMIDEVMWPNQPLGRDTAGTKESIASISREDLFSYLSSHYGPGNAVISVAGLVTPEQVEEATARYFGGWRPVPTMPWYPVLEASPGPKVNLKSKKTEQANFCLGVYGVDSEHPDRYAQDVMNTLLGEGMSSRLFLQIRERLGLAYDVHSYVNHFRDTGSQVVFAGVDPRKTNQAIQAILAELSRFRDGVPESELTRAKESMKGRLLLRLEDTSRVSSWTGAQELLRNSIMTVDEAVSIIDSISSEDIQRVACNLFVRENLNLAIVGPYRSEGRFTSLLNL
ncbi:MAG: M16 family metallopeptidase [Chloroflexota bacterium]